jgi:hypothetical protein
VHFLPIDPAVEIEAQVRATRRDATRARRPRRGARNPSFVSIHWFPYDRVGVVNADP